MLIILSILSNPIKARHIRNLCKTSRRQRTESEQPLDTLLLYNRPILIIDDPITYSLRGPNLYLCLFSCFGFQNNKHKIFSWM